LPTLGAFGGAQRSSVESGGELAYLSGVTRPATIALALSAARTRDARQGESDAGDLAGQRLEFDEGVERQPAMTAFPGSRR